MPNFLIEWLRSLSPEQADQVWQWADQAQYGLEAIVTIVAPIAQKADADV